MTAFHGFHCSGRALALVAAVVAASLATLAPARADDGPGWLTKALGLRTEAPVAPEFVQKTRPKTTNYVPVHTPRVAPPSKPMTKEQVAAQEKSLDSSRRQHDRIAGRAGAKPEKSVADGLDARKDKTKANESCGLTCANRSLLPAQPGREYR